MFTKAARIRRLKIKIAGLETSIPVLLEMTNSTRSPYYGDQYLSAVREKAELEQELALLTED